MAGSALSTTSVRLIVAPFSYAACVGVIWATTTCVYGTDIEGVFAPGGDGNDALCIGTHAMCCSMCDDVCMLDMRWL